MKKLKFVVVTDKKGVRILRLGYVEFHSDLVDSNNEVCHGGGMFVVDNENKTVTMTGRSVDFGVPKFGIIMRVENKRPGTITVGQDYKFIYLKEDEIWFGKKETELIEVNTGGAEFV